MAPRQLPPVRVPIPVVIPLCLGVVGGVWWFGTRDRDFLTQPPERELALIRQQASGGIPTPDQAEVVAEETAPARTESAPVIPPKTDDPPQLADFRNRASEGADSLVSLARGLETQGKIQHALLAWERVLDSTAPEQIRTSEAIQAIKRIRPALSAWNTDPATAVAITIRAGADETTAATLAPALGEVARDIEQASSGILKVTASVAAGNEIPEHRGPAPIAIWLAGPGVESRSTEVFIFTNKAPETLRDDIVKILFKLIRAHLGGTASLTVPEAISPDAAPMDVMSTHITRLGWLKLGSQLNKTP